MTGRALQNDGILLICLLTLFLCRAVLASAIVRPWQGPDEPTHFALVRLLAVPQLDTAALVMMPDDSAVTKIERDLQRGVLMSMDDHRWWEAYGGRAPEPLPTRFPQIVRIGNGTYALPLYYGVGAATLRVTQPSSLEAGYFHLRALNVALTVVALGFGWAGTRLLFGPTVAVGAAAVAVLHPQFLLTAINVNPDALLNVWGAFMWWQVARVVRRHRPGMSAILVIVAAVAALLTKRSAVPLGAVAAIVVAASVFAPQTVRIKGRVVFLWLTALGVCGIILVAGWLAFEGSLRGLGMFWRSALNIRRPLDEKLLSEAVEYAKLSTDYVWLVAGWLRYSAPEPWLWITRTLTVIGFAGAVVMTIRTPGLRRPLACAWLFVIVQLATVIGWGFFTLSSPQGRYLFPMIAPATALLWLGLTQAAPARFRPYSVPILISILAVLDVTGFTTVLIPAYLPWY